MLVPEFSPFCVVADFIHFHPESSLSFSDADDYQRIPD